MKPLSEQLDEMEREAVRSHCQSGEDAKRLIRALKHDRDRLQVQVEELHRQVNDARVVEKATRDENLYLRSEIQDLQATISLWVGERGSDSLQKVPNGIPGVSVWEERDALLVQKADLQAELDYAGSLYAALPIQTYESQQKIIVSLKAAVERVKQADKDHVSVTPEPFRQKVREILGGV
jgi:hypothetical protein